MKRQADGIRLSDDTEEIEQTEENGNKRRKLLNNEINKENAQVDCAKENSMMDIVSGENSQRNDYEDQIPPIPNVSSYKNISPEHADSENYSVQNVFENELIHENLSKIDNCNGSYEVETVVKTSSNDSVNILEFNHANHHENTVLNTEKNIVCNDTEQEPSPVNHCDHDLHNNKLTDSFHDESLNAENAKDSSENGLFQNHKNDSNCKVSEKYAGESISEILEKDKDELCQDTPTASKIDINYEIQDKNLRQEQDNNLDEFSFESNVKKIIDPDNLTLSQLKVSELVGHTEEILCVGADEDFILSSSADTTTKVWNMERQNVISTFSGHSNSVTSVLLLNPNQSKKIKKKMSLTKVSRIAITGSLDCNIKLWSVLEGKELASVYTFNGITCLGYLESECLVVVGTEGGKLELWDLSLKKPVVSERAHEDKVTDIKVIDNYIYSVSIDGTVKVWSYEDEDLFPVYSRKRKECSFDKNGFRPAQWETVTVSENIIYLGDNTSSIKMLDWRAGRLTLFKNQVKRHGVCSSIAAKENVLFTSSYDTFTETGGINVWKLPEMTYVCTLAGAFLKINNIAVVQKDDKLKIITGGDKLFISEFDFSKPPSSEEEFFVCEHEMLGHEINENPVEIRKPESNSICVSKSDESNSKSNRWCNIM